jgi:hypothetical protein
MGWLALASNVTSTKQSALPNLPLSQLCLAVMGLFEIASRLGDRQAVAHERSPRLGVLVALRQPAAESTNRRPEVWIFRATSRSQGLRYCPKTLLRPCSSDSKDDIYDGGLW